MPGGIQFGLNAESTVAALSGVITRYYSGQAPSGPVPGPWRPPQWANAPVVSLTVPAAYAAAASPTGATNQTPTNPLAPIVYVFDAVPRIHHSRRATPTSHPLQTGANFADHVIIQPVQIEMDIVMTDAAAMYAPGMWTGNSSKSVSAFQTLLALQEARVPLTLQTRLNTYENIFVVDVPAEETVRSCRGLRATIMLQQLFVANVAVATVSARPNTTAATALGTTQPTPPSQAVTSNFQLPSRFFEMLPKQAMQQTGTVYGAGDFSSNITSDLSSTLGVK